MTGRQPTIHKCRAFAREVPCGRPAVTVHPLLPQLLLCEQHLEERGHVQPLPCITLWQPWASWIAWGLKTIETRRHDRLRCLLGREIGIHAGERYDPTATRIARRYAEEGALDERPDRPWSLYYGGGIVARAFVAGFRQLTDADSKAALFPCHQGDRWGLVLEGVEELRPYIVAKGKQGVWYYV